MSTFFDVLDFLGRPQQVAVNLLAGRPVEALKHGVQFGSDIIDAFLPTDVLPDITTPADRLEGSEIFGMDENSHWLPRIAADLGVGVATDPLTYIGFGAGAVRAAAAGAARTAAKTVAGGIARNAAKYADDVLRTAAESGDLAARVDDIMRTTPSSGAKEARKLAEQAIRQSAEAEATTTAVNTTLRPEQATAVRAALQRGLSKAGRKLPAADKTSILDDIIENAGDFSEGALAKAIDRHGDLFVEGGLDIGVPFGPKARYLEGVRVDPLYMAKKALDTLPEAVRGPLAKAGKSIAETANWLRPGAYGRTIIDAAEAAGENSVRTAGAEIKAALSNLSSAERETLFDAFQGVRKVGSQFEAIVEAKPLGLADATTQVEEISKRIMALNLPTEQTQKLLDASQGIIKHTMGQYAQAVEEGLMFAPRMYLDADGVPHAMDDVIESFILGPGKNVDELDIEAFLAGTAKKSDWDTLGDVVNSSEFDDYTKSLGLEMQDVDPRTFSPGLYMQRNFSKVAPDGRESLGALPAFLASRKLKTPEQVQNFLNTPGADLVRDPTVALHGRALQQGAALKRATLGRKFLGDDFKLYKAADRKSFTDAVAGVATADPAFHDIVKAISEGMPPRGGMTNFLAKTNRVFKPAAVFGYILPKINTNMRNAMSMAWQTMSIPESRFRSMAQLKEAVPNVWKSFKDAYHDAFGGALERVGLVQSSDEISSMLKHVDDAFAQGGNAVDNLANPDLQEALRYGVLDNFVTVEDLARAIEPSGKGAWKDWVKAFDEFARRPGGMFQGIESRGRLATFLALRKQGYGGDVAAQIVKDAFLDYRIANPKNRALRDIIPFASFMTQTALQQTELMNAKPAVAAALNQLFGGQDESDAGTPEWIAGQAHLRLGEDEEGKRLYAAGLGLPPEALGAVPGVSGDLREVGMDFKRGVIGATHPIIKTAYTLVSGRDPYFDSPAMSYARTPELLQAVGVPEESEVGRMYQFAKSTGMIQPVASPLTITDQMLDDRKNLASRALNLLTGVNVVSVDEERARLSNLARKLELDPTVRSLDIFYGDKDNPLLQEYKEAQRMKRRASDME